MRFLLCSLLLLAPVVFSGAHALELKFNIEKYTLKNGMVVILHQDKTVPLVSVHQWYRVGSKDEKVGRTGLAHFFEHLMFKGTERLAGKQYEKMIHMGGADNNAFTSQDYTGYYTNIPPERLRWVLGVESDRMINLLFDQKEIQSEREVVKEERRMRTENSVEGSLDEKLHRLLYQVGAYRWPVIGSMEDLNAASIEDLKSFYKTYYSPNNSVLVIAGNFDVSQAKKWIQELYGSIPSQKVERPEFLNEIENLAKTDWAIERLKKEVQAETMLLGFRGPEIKSEDNYALDLLSVILGAGNSSRFHQLFVRQKKKAIEVAVDYDSGYHGGIFYILLQLAPGVKSDSVIPDLKTQIEKVKTEKVSDAELKKAKNLLLKAQVNMLRKISGRARMLAYYEVMLNDPELLTKNQEKYAAVTSEQIMEVAKKYLTTSRGALVIAEPAKGSQK